MRLSDVVAHSGLAIYAEVALLLFLLAFVAVLIRTFRPGARREMDEMSRLPLEDDTRPSHDDALPGNDEPQGAPARRRANG